MLHLIALAGLLVSLVSAEAASQPPKKKSLLLLYGKRGDLSVTRAIEQNIREIFHASAWREIDFFSERCACACFPLCFRTIYLPVLCR